MRVLIDTNILVYAWESNEKEKQARAIEVLNQYKETAFLSVQNLSEFSSVMLRKGSDLNWLDQVISTFSKVMVVLPLSGEEVKRAIYAVKKYKMNYWDALVWAVAVNERIPVILTEDGPVGQEIEGVYYRNPLTEVNR